MHHVREALDGVQLFDLHSAEFADPAEIISAEIHQHVVLRKLFFVRQKFGFQSPIFRICFSSRPGPRQRECVQHTVLQLDEGLGGRARNFDIRSGEIEHIRGRIDRAQDAVGVKEASFKGRAEAVREHDLENISLVYVVLCLFHHAAELFPLKERGHLAEELSARFVFLFPVPEKVCELLKFHDCLSVSDFGILKRHVDDERDLLPKVIKGDDLVKKHQIDVFESLIVFHRTSRGRFAVTEIVIGKISDESPRKRRKIIKTGAFIVCEDLPKRSGRIIGPDF